MFLYTHFDGRQGTDCSIAAAVFMAIGPTDFCALPAILPESCAGTAPVLTKDGQVLGVVRELRD